MSDICDGFADRSGFKTRLGRFVFPQPFNVVASRGAGQGQWMISTSNGRYNPTSPRTAFGFEHLTYCKQGD